jgi:hypothetical protein
MADKVATRSGWITFAGVMAVLAGGYNALSGIAALTNDDTIASQAKDVLYGIDLTAWGWFWLVIGLAQVVTGVLIFQRNTWGLWLGVSFAGLSAMLTVIVMFVFPLWAIAVMTIDFLILFGLLTQSDEFLA